MPGRRSVLLRGLAGKLSRNQPRSDSGPSSKSGAALKWSACRRTPERARDAQNDAFDRAPRGRELSVREDLTRIIVDWSGSWQAARPGNWLGRSPATKAALGC